MIRILRRIWKWYAPKSLDEAIAEALYRGLRHDEVTGR